MLSKTVVMQYETLTATFFYFLKIGSKAGKLNRFLIEPFIAHKAVSFIFKAFCKDKLDIILYVRGFWQQIGELILDFPVFSFIQYDAKWHECAFNIVERIVFLKTKCLSVWTSRKGIFYLNVHSVKCALPLWWLALIFFRVLKISLGT